MDARRPFACARLARERCQNVSYLKPTTPESILEKVGATLSRNLFSRLLHGRGEEELGV